MLKRPLKAPTEPIPDELLGKLSYPVVGSPKLDGFRCMIDNGPKTSTMKSFMNKFICSELTHPELDGLDGEIVVGDIPDPKMFHNTSGPVRRFEGEPDFKLYAFDRFIHKNLPYEKRWLDTVVTLSDRIVILPQTVLTCPDDVLKFEQLMLNSGFEGAMIRSLRGEYKEGRSTFNEQIMFKRKPFVEAEATIIGFVEALENQNEPEENELGLSKRSHHAANMVPKGVLGSFILQSPLWSKSFRAALGKGYTAKDRKEFWETRLAYLGQIATIKYQKFGSWERPRMPSVIKIRPSWDITDY